METEQPQAGRQVTAAPNMEQFTALAAKIGDGPCRGRTGFGALRHYDSIWRDTIRLVAESGFLISARERRDWMLFDDEFFHFHFGRRAGYRPGFFVDALGSPSNYSPPCLWSLFWSLAKAEHEFLGRFIPFWSNEERLTGHLVSQMVERLEEFSPHWKSLASPDENGEEPHCRIMYADTATARRESLTGADLGLIVQARWPGQEEFFKVVRFQAKKVARNGQAQIDYDQVEALVKRPSVGYYLFYHAFDPAGWNLAPTVRSASGFEGKAKELRSKKTGPLGKESVAVQGNGFDLACFVTFGMADPAAEHGEYVLDPKLAIRAVMAAEQPLAPTSRVMVVTLGSGTSVVDWQELLHEYLVSQQDAG